LFTRLIAWVIVWQGWAAVPQQGWVSSPTDPSMAMVSPGLRGVQHPVTPTASQNAGVVQSASVAQWALQSAVPLQPKLPAQVWGVQAPVGSQISWQLLGVGSMGQSARQQLTRQMPDAQAELASLVLVGTQALPAASFEAQAFAAQ
jgi:hypothetical protein